MRQVSGLRWAKRMEARPGFIPIGRPRGAKAQGIRYEKALGLALGPEARRGVWWEFEDAQGHGYCQTDFLLELAQGSVILEVKYTWVPEGHQQIEGLYGPVVAAALGKPAVGLVVAKRLVQSNMMVGVVVAGELKQALEFVGKGQRVCWHCPWPIGSLAKLTAA